MTQTPSPPPAATSGQGAPTYLGEVPWRRLDPRMLLVHPVHELVRFLPFLVGVLVLGSTGDSGGWWQLVGVLLPVAVGVLRFLTTRFRITPTQVELRRGLLGRSTLTARLDRVRAVELTSTPVHRLLGLAKVQIGTASSAKDHDETFTLDALPLAHARDLRIQLLHRSEVADTDAALEPSSDGASPPAPVADQTLVRLDPRWARYAPLTASGSVVTAAIAGALGQFGDDLYRLLDGGRGLGWVRDAPLGVLLSGGAVTFLVLGAVFGVLGYWISYAGFTLTRDARGRTYHVRRGLFTSRETSLEAERVRGVQVGEPLGLRLVGAARLSALTTGLSRRESGATLLVPPAPRQVVDTTAALVLGDPRALGVPLVEHGPAARRRRWTRAVGPVAVLLLAAVVVCLLTPVAWWVLAPVLVALPLAGALAEDRFRRLGHALAAGHLMVRSGSLNGRLSAVQRTGIIGWNFQQSWFQRRAGVVTLVATTAAGQQAYAALDVPETEAIRLASEAVPGMLTPFLSPLGG